jgi:hypothetical protein
MEIVTDLLKILLPGGLAVYGMYIVTVSFLKKEWEKRVLELKTKSSDTLLPIRLQAAERLCLLLERITPNNLVRRVNQGGLTATELHSLLINEVREEFNHNLSQQVYFSEEAWEEVRNSVEQVITLVNRANKGLSQEAVGIELAKRIFQLSLENENDVIARARKKIKSEIQVYF